jgi:hypothetical protein
MKSRSAPIFLAIISALMLCGQALQETSPAEEDIEPGVPFCGHISASSSKYYNATIEPHALAMSFALRWRNNVSALEVVLRSPGGRVIEPETLADFKRCKASLSFSLPEPEAGRWSVEIRSAATPAGGDDYCLSFRPVQVVDVMDRASARFNGLYKDYGHDENGDGFYEYIILKTGVDIRVPGNYTIEGYLYDVNDGKEIHVLDAGRLNVGSQAIELHLYGMAAPGPYRLKALALYDENGDVADRSSAVYTTHEYQNLVMVMRGASLKGNYSDYGSDIDGDGFYDYLTLDVEVDVFSPGNYSLMGFLCDSKGEGLVWSLGFGDLLPGTHTMHVDFDGKTLWQSGINGPYTLHNLSLLSGDSFLENLTDEDTVIDAYITKPYNYTQFVDPVWPERGISGSGQGEVLLTISVESLLPVFQGRYSLDIVGVTMPPISSNWTVTGSEGGYAYDLTGVHMPERPNNFTVTARGAKNLNVGVRREFAGAGVDFTRAWVTAQALAGDDGRAIVESDLISPGRYQFKAFGDAADNATEVAVELKVIKRLMINGDFNLSLNTDGLPSGNYSISARALNGSLRLDEINMVGPNLKF